MGFPDKTCIVITCEHGGHQIPDELQSATPMAKKKVLTSHEGWDIGALFLAKNLAGDLSAPLFYSEVSRLVCDLNRTVRTTGPFARNIKPYTQIMTAEELLARYYWPYRMKVEETLSNIIKSKSKVLHLSIHSFTPKLKGEVRQADIGILYDPHRSFEKELAHHLKDSFQQQNISGQINATVNEYYRIRMNYPYMGTDDGFTTYLRTIFSDESYAGIEIEFNQIHLINQPERDRIYDFFRNSLFRCLDH